MIDPEGNFFHYYQDLLIVKQHEEVVESWRHHILLDVKETSFLQISMGSEYAVDIHVKVYSKYKGM